MQASQNLVNREIGNNTFGGGAWETVLGPGVLVLLLVAIVLILLVRRKFILGPLMFGLFLLPVGQTLVLGGLHLYVSRMLISHRDHPMRPFSGPDTIPSINSSLSGLFCGPQPLSFGSEK